MKYSLIFRSLCCLLLIFGSHHIYGHPLPDSLLPFSITRTDSLLPFSAVIRDEEEAFDLQSIENEYSLNRDNRKTLLHLYRALKVKKAFGNRRNRARALYDLAGVSARLKLYPQAMSCYYHTLQLEDSSETDKADPGSAPPITLDTTLTGTVYSLKESPPVSNEAITASFGDGKEASSYAMILEVKQPTTGKRKAFAGFNNVGHMFITLIKYNTDNTCVVRSFGFYPQKDGLFSGTPLHPSSSSFFRDDALHDWDELAGKFISGKRFEKILRLLQRYENRTYHLSENNCTDFGLSIASLVGIQIRQTRGTWPLGSGNNPANAGQSILEGRLMNTDAGGKEGLFICTSR